MYRFYIFLLIFFTTAPLSAQLFDDPAFRNQIYQGMDLMYEMRYNEADAFFLQLERQYPDHPSGYFMRGFNRWWQTYLSITTDEYYDFIEEQVEMALEKNEEIEKNKELEREHAFFEYMSYGLLARLDAYRDQFFPAVNQARKAIPAVKRSLKFVGKEPEFYLVAGLYHYYVATYSDYYPIVRPLMYFFPDGDKQKGLEEMELAGATPGFTQQEANFFLTYIYLDELPDLPKGLKTARGLYQKYPRNTWFHTDYARALLLNKQYEAGKIELEKLRSAYIRQSSHQSRNITSLESRHTSYLMIKVYHYLGYEALFAKNSYQTALNYFAQSNRMAKLAKVEEDNYLAGNQLYMGICHDHLFQRDMAIQAYENTLDMEENTLYKDDAKKYLKSPATGTP